MKLVTFLSENREERLGIRLSPAGPPGRAGHDDALQASGRILDIGAAWSHAATSVAPPRDMLDLIARDREVRPVLDALVGLSAKLPAALFVAEADAFLLSPIPQPLSMRDGYAFRQHVEAARRNRGVPMIEEFDHFPIFYFTNHLAVTGPGDVSVQKRAQDKLDFELEVAVVVGKEGRNLPAARADEHIFGYMVMNDWSARTLQMDEMKLNLGPAKGKDFATSLGPYLVTRDELAPHARKGPHGERHALEMRAFVNGKRFSLGNLQDMTWTFAQILERASYGVTLQPGEVIGSGTVGTGCLMELNGSEAGRAITGGVWLKPGDEVVMEVEALGRLENTVLDGGE